MNDKSSHPIGSIIGPHDVKHRGNVNYGGLSFAAEFKAQYNLSPRQVHDILEILDKCQAILGDAGDDVLSMSIYVSDILQFLADAMKNNIRNGGDVDIQKYVIDRYAFEQPLLNG